jgi:hypothetical protein
VALHHAGGVQLFKLCGVPLLVSEVFAPIDQGRSQDFPDHGGYDVVPEAVAADPHPRRVVEVLVRDVTRERDDGVVAGLHPLAEVQVGGILGNAMFWT